MIQVEAHGLKWILNNHKLICPECNGKRMNNIEIATDENFPNYAKALCECKRCQCVFVIERDERIK